VSKKASRSDKRQLVLSSLEPEQLARLKKHLIPRRHLSGLEKFVMWSLRIYLLFMVVVVIYQVWASLH
jgi:hypothetical protein